MLAQDPLDFELPGDPRRERRGTAHVFRLGGNGTARPGAIEPGLDGVSNLGQRQLITGWYGAGTWHVDFSGVPSNHDGVRESGQTTWGNTSVWSVMPGAGSWSAK
jgi:hypothetical protein